MDSQPEEVPEIVADVAQNSDEEGDTLISQRPVKRVQSKRCSLTWNITLLLCPYLSGIIFLTVFGFISYFYFISAPIVTLLNALPDTTSVMIDLSEISSSLYQHGSGEVSVQVADQSYSYGYTNYLFNLPPASNSECSLTFCSLDYEIEPDYNLYSINSAGCIAYLSGNHTSVDGMSHTSIDSMSKVSFAPQICQSNTFIGINLDKTLCSSPRQTPDSLCKLNFIKIETEATHPVPTGLYQVSGTVNVSLPRYSHGTGCKKIDPGSSFPSNSTIVIESKTNTLSICRVAISTKTDLGIFIPFFVSAFFITLFLTACDFSSWIFKRLLKKKFQ